MVSYKYDMRILLLIVIFVALGHALNVKQSVRGWFSSDPFASHSNCTYKDDDDKEQWEDYTRAQIWDCLLAMGDSNGDGKLTLDEIKQGRKEHLNWKEKLAAPYAQTLINNCSPRHGAKELTKATFMASESIDCAGTEKNICRVRGVCVRELKAMEEAKKSN